MRGTIVAKLIGAIFILVAALVVFALFSAKATEKAAASYLSDLRALRPRESSLAEATALAKRYGSRASLDPTCNAKKCSFVIWFKNTSLAQLHFAHPAYLYSAVTVSNDTVDTIHVDSGCYGRNGGLYLASVVDSISDEGSVGSFRVFRKPLSESSQALSVISVHLGSGATAEEHQRAYDFDAHFLNRLGACTSASEMLPISGEGR